MQYRLVLFQFFYCNCFYQFISPVNFKGSAIVESFTFSLSLFLILFFSFYLISPSYSLSLFFSLFLSFSFSPCISLSLSLSLFLCISLSLSPSLFLCISLSLSLSHTLSFSFFALSLSRSIFSCTSDFQGVCLFRNPSYGRKPNLVLAPSLSCWKGLGWNFTGKKVRTS